MNQRNSIDKNGVYGALTLYEPCYRLPLASSAAAHRFSFAEGYNLRWLVRAIRKHLAEAYLRISTAGAHEMAQIR